MNQGKLHKSRRHSTGMQTMGSAVEVLVVPLRLWLSGFGFPRRVLSAYDIFSYWSYRLVRCWLGAQVKCKRK